MPNSKQRREAERRRLERQVQRRRQRDVQRRRTTLIASIVGTIVLVAIVVTVVVATGNDSSTKTATSPTKGASSSTAAAGKHTCTFKTTGKAARTVSLPGADPATSGEAVVHVTTNRGPMTFTLDRAAAPCAAASFVSLAGQKFFDSTPCHRLVTSGIYVLQCGDPTGTGSGGPGYSFADELTGKEKYTRGVLAMANSGANTNGSQFFIVYKDSTLNPSYTVFGHVTSGLSVVDKVAKAGATGSSGDGKPKLSIELQKVTLAA